MTDAELRERLVHELEQQIASLAELDAERGKLRAKIYVTEQAIIAIRQRMRKEGFNVS